MNLFSLSSLTFIFIPQSSCPLPFKCIALSFCRSLGDKFNK